MPSRDPKIALVLGGGAPNLTLMAGALAALDEQGVAFDVLSTSGAGMLIGMLYAAPKGKSRLQALKDTVDLGVHDLIYDHFPVNYKVFHKVGPMAEAYGRMIGNLPPFPFPNDSYGRLARDWTAFCLSSMAPFDQDWTKRLGLCQPAPWIDKIVDFDKLTNESAYTPEEAYQGDVILNAWCLEDEKMVMFPKEELTPAHFHAALAFPMIYEPVALNGKTYIEGSAIDPLNFEGLLDFETAKQTLVKPGADALAANDKRAPQARAEQFQKLTDIVVMDVLGHDKLIRQPRDLYDSWVKSMIVPLVSVAKKNLKLFEHVHNRDDKGQAIRNVHRISFEIPEAHWPLVLDWSFSNLDTLFNIGFEAGERLVKRRPELAASAKPTQQAANSPHGKDVVPLSSANRKGRAPRHQATTH